MVRKARAIDLADLLGSVRIVPVLTLERAEDAVPVAAALVQGGLHILEITLRTEAALEAVKRIRGALPKAVVGVGSVVDPCQFATAVRAGAQFAVSPGATAELAASASEAKIPWLPAAQSVSEVLALRSRGFRLLKFFPAQQSGGVEFLRSLLGPVPDVRFCPTGGITPRNIRHYLAVPNVLCVGGSWLAPASVIRAADWGQIRKRAQQTQRWR